MPTYGIFSLMKRLLKLAHNGRALPRAQRSNLIPKPFGQLPGNYYYTLNSIVSTYCFYRRKSTTKKNKTWDGDGMLHQVGKTIKLFSEDGKKT
jgi:hypothetical protein